MATRDLWTMVGQLKAIGLDFKAGEEFMPLFFMDVFRFVLRDSQPPGVAGGQIDKWIETADSLASTGPKRYQKSPVDVFTGEMLYFGKALDLLYSVSSRLSVRHPILQTLLQRAYSALLSRTGVPPPVPWRPGRCLPAPEALPCALKCGPLERELAGLLLEFYRKGELLGAQLCILELPAGGRPLKPLADFALGVRAWLEPSPVTRQTLFNLLDLSKLLPALAVLRLVGEGRLRLGARLAESWPAFAKSGPGEERSAVTVEHVLSHRAGLWRPLPAGIRDLSHLLDPEAALAAVAAEAAAEPPGGPQRYHYTSFGYLCAGLCRHLAGEELESAVERLLDTTAAAAKGLGGEGEAQRILQRLSSDPSVSAAAAPVQAPISSAGLDEVSGMIARLAAQIGGEEAFAAAALGTAGREHLLHPSLFGDGAEGVASARLPGLQAFGTARSVAELLAAVASGGVLQEPLLREALQSRSAEAAAEDPGPRLAEELRHILRLEAFEEWGLGLQLLRPGALSPAGATPTAAAGGGGGKPMAWGHLSQTGSAALVLPRPEGGAFCMGLLLNMTAGAEASSHHIADAVLDLLRSRAAGRP
uniref:Beta-lactamase-related domain-containing protein n=1 Tax=Alexandrium monilatum TaxID=311494 RepID=A0A7S4PXF8_9DINO